MIDIIEDVCSIVELSVSLANKDKVDKKAVVMSVLDRLYPESSPNEKLEYSKLIEYYVKHGLQAVSRFKRFRRYISSFFCSLNGGENHQSV